MCGVRPDLLVTVYVHLFCFPAQGGVGCGWQCTYRSIDRILHLERHADLVDGLKTRTDRVCNGLTDRKGCNTRSTDKTNSQSNGFPLNTSVIRQALHI